jgi:hypothetical protein
LGNNVKSLASGLHIYLLVGPKVATSGKAAPELVRDSEEGGEQRGVNSKRGPNSPCPFGSKENFLGITLFFLVAAKYDLNNLNVFYLKILKRCLYVGFLHNLSCILHLANLILFYQSNWQRTAGDIRH